MKTTRILPLIIWALFCPATFGQGSQEIDITDQLTCKVSTVFTGRAGPGINTPLALDFINEGEDLKVRVELSSWDSKNTAVFFIPGQGQATLGFMRLHENTYYSPRIQFYNEETKELLLDHQLRFNLTTSVKKKHLHILTISMDAAPKINSNLCKKHTMVFNTIDPFMAPDSWMGYTPADLVVIPVNTYKALIGKKQAILNWVTMGGVCLIVGANQQDKADILFDVQEKFPLVCSPSNDRIEIGVGMIRFVSATDLMRSSFFKTPPNQTRDINTAVRGFHDLHPQERLQAAPPFLLVLLILVIFTIFVGPVGWWYAVKKKAKPLAYFTTAPLLSGIVILLIFTMDYLNQGAAPSASCAAVELIDQNVQKRVTFSQFALFCPYVINLELVGDNDELPHFIKRERDRGRHYYYHSHMNHGYYNCKQVHVSPHKSGVVYRGEALPVRRGAWYGREKIALERQRLEIWKEGDTIHVENHLGVPLEELVFCLNREYARVKSLDAGEKKTAQIIPKKEALQRVHGRVVKIHSLKSVFLPMTDRLSEQMEKLFTSEMNVYSAIRRDEYHDLIWLEEAKFKHSIACLWGVF